MRAFAGLYLGWILMAALCGGCGEAASPGTTAETCTPTTSCGAAGQVSLCLGGPACRLTVGTASFPCTACGDCQAALVAATTFCASNAGGPDGGPVVSADGSLPPPALPPASSGEATLVAVSSTHVVDSLGESALDVDVTLTNVSSSQPLPLAAELFSVTTQDGLVYRGSSAATPAAGTTEMTCDATASLAAGHQIECHLLVPLAASAVPATLTYQLPDGQQVQSPLSAPTCVECGGDCVDPTAFQADVQNCGQCGHSCSTDEMCIGGHCTVTEESDPGTAGSQTTCTQVCGGPGKCLGASAVYNTTFCIGTNKSFPVSCDDMPAAMKVDGDCTCDNMGSCTCTNGCGPIQLAQLSCQCLAP
jgi:hypothetical protein